VFNDVISPIPPGGEITITFFFCFVLFVFDVNDERSKEDEEVAVYRGVL